MRYASLRTHVLGTVALIIAIAGLVYANIKLFIAQQAFASSGSPVADAQRCSDVRAAEEIYFENCGGVL